MGHQSSEQEEDGDDFDTVLGMVEKLLANPFTRDGTLHPNLHLIYVDEVCGLFKLAGMLDDVIKKKVFPLSLKGDASTWCWGSLQNFKIFYASPRSIYGVY